VKTESVERAADHPPKKFPCRITEYVGDEFRKTELGVRIISSDMEQPRLFFRQISNAQMYGYGNIHSKMEGFYEINIKNIAFFSEFDNRSLLCSRGPK
jgi:hypothetical protein